MLGQARDLTRGKPFVQILLFTVPLLIGNLFQQFYNMADMVIVGRTINTNALAAIGATSPIAFLVVSFCVALTSGFTVITAQRQGAGDEDGVRKSVATSVLLSLAMSVVLTAASMASAYSLFEIMRTPADIIDDAYGYIIVIYAGTIVTIFFNLFAGILRALGDSLTPLLFLVVACFINVALDYILIVYFHMGVAGAGWATVIAQTVAVALCAVYSLRRFPILRLRREDWRVSRELVWRHLSIGLSMALQMVIISLSVIILQIGVNSLGTDAVKAFSAAGKIDQLATQPLVSLGVTMATFAAQNFGANRPWRIRLGVKQGALITAVLSLMGCLLMFGAGGWLLGLFGIGDGEPEVVRTAQMYLRSVSLCYIILGLLLVFRSTLQGMGRNTMPLAAAGVEVVIRMLATFSFVAWWGYAGLCAVNPLTWLGALAMVFIGYVRAMREERFTCPPNYESVVLYGNSGFGKYGSVSGSVPSASVRVQLDRPNESCPSDSVRIL